jgi:CheY-like chemotaxis protein
MVSASATAPRVLIVEDDPNVSEVVARYLEREGYTVETVADGAVGLERALAEPPDLVVLDLMLPGVGGLEVCRRVRAVAPGLVEAHHGDITVHNEDGGCRFTVRLPLSDPVV